MRASDLRPGDRFLREEWAQEVEVEVLREAESAVDRFGRSGHFKLYCKRVDTGAEGYVQFGPEGIVRVAD